MPYFLKKSLFNKVDKEEKLDFIENSNKDKSNQVFVEVQTQGTQQLHRSSRVIHNNSINLDTTIPIPSIKLQILPSKFQRPIPAIGLLDTRAQRIMINPDVLPSQSWQHY